MCKVGIEEKMKSNTRHLDSGVIL